MTTTISFQDDEVKTTIPKELYKAIVRIEASEDLDFADACIKLAKISDINGEAFKKAVQKEATKLAKSRFMRQLNIARETIKANSWEEGYDAGSKKYNYPCKVCGKMITLTEIDWEPAAKYLTESGWSHRLCLEKS